MYCTYITQHLETGKFYIGKSSLKQIAKGYKGSGKILHDAFKKYPPEQWVTSVLWEFETEGEAYSDEAQLVTEELLDDPLCLNVALGGSGGRKCRHTKERAAVLSAASRKRYDNKVGKTAAKACTVDGVLWFESYKSLTETLGHGYDGRRSPNLRYASETTK